MRAQKAVWTFVHVFGLDCDPRCRFYFVGDEDLLEIIGNSKNITRLQKHFKKMFAGVANILLDDDNNQVLGLASKEGEEVGDDAVVGGNPYGCHILFVYNLIVHEVQAWQYMSTNIKEPNKLKL